MSNWQKICDLTDIPQLGARVVKHTDGDVALFRNHEDEVFAVLDRCPHKGGPLSQGIVFGNTVACPMHGWNINLETGVALAPDKGFTPKFEVKVEAGVVFLMV